MLLSISSCYRSRICFPAWKDLSDLSLKISSFYNIHADFNKTVINIIFCYFSCALHIRLLHKLGNINSFWKIHKFFMSSSEKNTDVFTKLLFHERFVGEKLHRHGIIFWHWSRIFFWICNAASVKFFWENILRNFLVKNGLQNWLRIFHAGN